ncbi:MAG: glycosyltransferase family 39 protein [Candidatus Woesearchaeota archaeon]
MRKLIERLKQTPRQTYIIIGILFLIMVFAFILRSYHMNYPTIGYHNMKEDHYLSLALNMRESGNYLRTTWFDCSGYFVNNYFGDSYQSCSANSDESPPAVWSLLLFFGIFGWKLWVARLFIILLAVLTIVPIYLIIKKLSHNDYLALLSAFIYAVLPLAIFFGRNIQMDAPSYFFSLFALYFFMEFIDTNTTKHFILGAVMFVLAAWYKPLSLFVLAALIFIIPWQTYKQYVTRARKYKIEIFVLLIAIILATIWPLYLAGAVMPAAKSLGAAGVDFSAAWFGKNGWVDITFSLFSAEYWQNYKPILFSYFADNYSWIGFWLMIIGFILFCLKYQSKISRFIFGYALGIALYIPLFAYKWNAHAYYQYPFLLFAALCIANVFFQAGMLLKSFTSHKLAKTLIQYLPLVGLLFLVAPFTESTARVFNTQFFGSDIAGTYINQHTNKGEIFLIERGIQSQVSWYAQRFYYALPDNETIIERLESERNLKYIVLTHSGVSTAQQKKSWQYIVDHYRIVQVGFIQTPQGPKIYHLVLEKGGTVDWDGLNGKPSRLITTYEFTSMKIPYYVIEP